MLQIYILVIDVRLLMVSSTFVTATGETAVASEFSLLVII